MCSFYILITKRKVCQIHINGICSPFKKDWLCWLVRVRKWEKEAKNVPARWWKIQQCSVYFKDVLIFLFWREISTVYSWQEQIKGPNFSPNKQLGLSLFFLFSVSIQPWLGHHTGGNKTALQYSFWACTFFSKAAAVCKVFYGRDCWVLPLLLLAVLVNGHSRPPQQQKERFLKNRSG